MLYPTAKDWRDAPRKEGPASLPAHARQAMR